jgi:lysophospholipase L1-like esterase
MRMTRFALPALLAAAVSATVLAAPASAAAGKYVALGDSYAVAPGTYTYDDPSEQDPCRRGPLTYPRLWAAAHPDVAFTEASCSGATAQEMLAQQVPQLTADTTLVTVQVGGNDVGFVAVLQNCILTLDDQDCIDGVEQAKAAATGVLPAALGQLYGAVRAAAPSARIVVVGYPRLYTIGGDCGIIGLSDRERTALNSAADTLADVISTQAGAAGFTYLDARPVFDPHTLCSGNDEWVTTLEWEKLNESYHPNAAGHRDGYLAALTALTG